MIDDDRLSKILISFSCLVTVAEADSIGEVTQLINFMSGINVKDKHLFVQLSSAMENNAFQNKSINFYVVIEHETTGMFVCNIFARTLIPFLALDR